MNHEPDQFLATALFGDDLHLDTDAPEVEMPDPFATVLERAQLNHALGQSGPSISTDFLAMPSLADDVDSDDGPVIFGPTIAKATSAAALLEKRYRFTKGAKAARMQKSENGKWMFEFGADGELIRGYEIEE